MAKLDGVPWGWLVGPWAGIWGKYLSPGWSNYHRSPHVRCHVGATRPWVGGRWRRCVIERGETSKLSQKSSLPSYKLQVTHDNLVLELKLSLCFVSRLCLVHFGWNWRWCDWKVVCMTGWCDEKWLKFRSFRSKDSPSWFMNFFLLLFFCWLHSTCIRIRTLTLYGCNVRDGSLTIINPWPSGSSSILLDLRVLRVSILCTVYNFCFSLIFRSLVYKPSSRF